MIENIAAQNEEHLDLHKETEQITNRREKLTKIRESGCAYPNFFKPNAWSADILERYQDWTEEGLTQETHLFRLAGRIMLRRTMGKATFLIVQDMTGRIQLYLRQDAVGKEHYESIKGYDIGDIIGACGTIFRTKTGELSIKVSELHLLTKALRPLPDKFHGLNDKEACYRQRYLDVLMNPESRAVFNLRSSLVSEIRHFLTAHRFMEVETPMLQVLAGGAAASPFVTHHHALDMPMYLRIAPELYLKRLVVGGFERVFELNRSFRNEGVSARHNPEFTMLEFYQAYADYTDFMHFIEEMMRTIAKNVLGNTTLNYQGEEINLAQPFKCLTLLEAICFYHQDIQMHQINDLNFMQQFAKTLGIPTTPASSIGKIQLDIFEKTIETRLIQPTFITQYPTEVSPLARANDENPLVCDRFELFVSGREIANGFSELNDPEDQAARFSLQMEHKAQGDEEAMPYDEDYIKALEYGLPPTAGAGIGIDRLTMLFANQPSIRDVLLFPHMRT